MDILLVLIVVLVIVVIWRGPKTLPALGKAFGQGVKEARKEMDEIKTDASGTKADAAAKDDTTPAS
jgi:TatA/E family protein of Tat protein translocase